MFRRNSATKKKQLTFVYCRSARNRSTFTLEGARVITYDCVTLHSIDKKHLTLSAGEESTDDLGTGKSIQDDKVS